MWSGFSPKVAFEPASPCDRSLLHITSHCPLRRLCAAHHNRRYQIDFDALDIQSLRELVRLIRDLDHEKQAAVNRARMTPWRLP
jgi:hypothetical protein